MPLRTDDSYDTREKLRKTHRKISKERERKTGTTQIRLQKTDVKESWRGIQESSERRQG